MVGTRNTPIIHRPAGIPYNTYELETLFAREKGILSRLSRDQKGNENVVSYYGLAYTEADEGYSERNRAIVMELCTPDLGHLIWERRNRLTEAEASYILRQIISAFAYMHEQHDIKVIHRYVRVL